MDLRPPPLRPSPLVLELDLTEPVLEISPTDPVAKALARRRTTLRALLDGLRRAERDDRVVAVVAKLGGDKLALARAQEIRTAVLALRARGKRTVAWAETFGELSSGTISYYLASAFDQVWLQPSGDLAAVGVSAEVPFLRGALDKAGIEPQIESRYEYKNARDLFMEREFTPAHREASERLEASAAEQIVAGIAESRGLVAQRVRELIDAAPLLAEQARAAGLVDRVGYRDEVYAEVRREARERAGRDAQLRFVGRYAKDVASSARERMPVSLRWRSSGGGRARAGARAAVALVHGTGPVKLGRSGRAPLPLSGPSMGSDTVTAALRAAGRDDTVRAVVFRVDSPGGSYAASDAIWREVGLLQRAGKPVVVSMGDVAASGGYFVAAPADTIVASPGTITGSIGVLAGKQVTAGLLERIGIGFGAVAEGDHALLYSSRRGYTDSERAWLERWLDAVYDDFTGKVAQGRGLSRAQVHEVARGRVWTGADARERGLVDELGGLQRAIELAHERACAAAGVPAKGDPVVKAFPAVSPLARLKPAESSEDPAAAAAVSAAGAAGAAGAVELASAAGVTAGYAGGWGPLAEIAARLALPSAGPLLAPAPWALR